MRTRFFSFLAVGLLLAACSKEGPKGDTGATGAAGPTGPAGSNGTNGNNGSNGQTSLTRITAEPAGANCASGGNKIETGLDANNNGVLDNSEVNATQTKYVCNGATGTANVIYSDWVSFLTSSSWKDTMHFNVRYSRAILNTSSITPSILDHGAILCYVKEELGAGTYGSIMQLPVKLSSSPNSVYTYDYIPNVGKLIFLFNVNQNGTIVTFTPPLWIRYVIIPGGVSGGRFTSGPVQGLTTEEIKRLSYEQVAQLLKIPASGSNTK